jgi:hydrogenase maturation protease
MLDPLPAARHRPPLTGSRALVIGLGNALRGDDAAGLAVVRAVHERAPALPVLELEREPSELIDAWAGADPALVVDAVAGSEPGRIHRLDAARGLVASLRRPSSSHDLGLAEVIELARGLDRLPRRLLVFGIEGAKFRYGEGLSSAVERRIDELAEAVIAAAGDLGNR